MRASSGLYTLFSNETRLRAVVDSVLEGHLGGVDADDVDHPRVARLRLGCYAMFAGDATAPDAEHLLRDVPSPLELIVPASAAWTSLLERVHAGCLVDRPMRSFSAETLRKSHLRDLAARVPFGYEIRKIDAAIARELGPELRPNGLQVMEDPYDFAARSGGVAALAGTHVACAATNYAFSAGSIELAIATHPDHRGGGLATCVAATWILHCLDAGVVPHWNAANPVSIRLAQRLGYVPADIVEVSFLNRDM